MDTSLVSKKLFASEFRLRSVSTGKSPVWSKFGIVTDSDRNDLEYTACKTCYQAYTYRGRSSSTAPMANHKCRASSGQTLLQPLLQTTKKQGTANPTTQQKQAMTDACVDMVCMDLLPFDTIEGEGFVRLAQKV